MKPVAVGGFHNEIIYFFYPCRPLIDDGIVSPDIPGKEDCPLAWRMGCNMHKPRAQYMTGGYQLCLKPPAQIKRLAVRDAGEIWKGGNRIVICIKRQRRDMPGEALLCRKHRVFFLQKT